MIELHLPQLRAGAFERAPSVGRAVGYFENTDVQWAGSKTLSLSFKEIKLMSQEVYASRVASEIVVPTIGEWGNLTDTTGSASILEGEQTATATPKEPKSPKT